MWLVQETRCQENFGDETVKSLLDKFVLVIVDGDTEPEALAALEAKQGFPHLIFQSARAKGWLSRSATHQ